MADRTQRDRVAHDVSFDVLSRDIPLTNDAAGGGEGPVTLNDFLYTRQCFEGVDVLRVVLDER